MLTRLIIFAQSAYDGFDEEIVDAATEPETVLTIITHSLLYGITLIAIVALVVWLINRRSFKDVKMDEVNFQAYLKDVKTKNTPQNQETRQKSSSTMDAVVQPVMQYSDEVDPNLLSYFELADLEHEVIDTDLGKAIKFASGKQALVFNPQLHSKNDPSLLKQYDFILINDPKHGYISMISLKKFLALIKQQDNK